MAFENLRILWKSWADYGLQTIDGIVASSEAGNMVVENVLNSLPGIVWRSTGVTSETIRLKFTKARQVNAVVLYSNNFTNSATITITAFSDAAFTTPIVGAEFITPGGEPELGFGEGAFGLSGFGGYDDEAWDHPFMVRWIDLTTAQYWEIKVVNPTNPLGYIEIGRLLVGQYFTPVFNMDWGYPFGWNNDSQQDRTRGGDLRTERRPSHRDGSFTLANMGVSDANQIREMLRYVGKSRDMLISAYPEATDSDGYQNNVVAKLTDWRPLRKDRGGYSWGCSYEETTGYL